ncbi:Protein max [Liparis tanakae]|uniref:Protein max n=1 Tax=Liparis tanakae TaxID=230148 RepID=A0A4Z2E899_9TELE|nr:Protein max [Liparis tanakae]
MLSDSRDVKKSSLCTLDPEAPPPALNSASRAQILDKATEYIQYMRRKNHTHQQDIDDLKRQNALLEQQGNVRTPPCLSGSLWGGVVKEEGGGVTISTSKCSRDHWEARV